MRKRSEAAAAKNVPTQEPEAAPAAPTATGATQCPGCKLEISGDHGGECARCGAALPGGASTQPALRAVGGGVGAPLAPVGAPRVGSGEDKPWGDEGPTAPSNVQPSHVTNVHNASASSDDGIEITVTHGEEKYFPPEIKFASFTVGPYIAKRRVPKGQSVSDAMRALSVELEAFAKEERDRKYRVFSETMQKMTPGAGR